MQLSPHFSRAEMEFSDAAAREGIDNSCPDSLLPNLTRTCWLLEDARRRLDNKPVIVNSGYRAPQVNKLVGGSSESAHMEARAADIRVPGTAPIDVARALAATTLDFDKLILEFGRWVHLQVPKIGNTARRLVYTARKNAEGKTEYVEGIVS